MSDAITAVMTGNEAAATAARLARVQVVAAYPITPQSPVVETLSKWVEEGELPAELVRVESEHSALTVCIAAASVGARVFTATSANGLAYMNEQIWWAAGARLPVVMCCANRAMAAPWNVLNDQQDSMSVRDAGWIQLYCRDNQEILDTTLQAYRLAESLHLPVLVCYDGFLLSHTVMPVEIPSEAAVDEFLPRVSPLQIVDLADPRNIGPVTLADPRPDALGVLCHGYMELRALHHRALASALEAIPAVDQLFARTFGRSWGGLTWGHLLEDAELVLVAAGSLGMELAAGGRAPAGRGDPGRRARHPRLPPLPARGHPGGAGRAAAVPGLRQGGQLRPRGPHLLRRARRARRRGRRAARLRRHRRAGRARRDHRPARRHRATRGGRCPRGGAGSCGGMGELEVVMKTPVAGSVPVVRAGEPGHGHGDGERNR